MSGWVAQLIAASGLLLAGTQSALQYVKTLPPRPDQTNIQCHDANWEAETLADIQGSKVHKKLAPFVVKLLSDAQQAGHTLTITSAHRTCAYQGQLRALSCGTGDYNMTLKPIDECSPPTEPAGRSLHNEGLAVDFACSGYGVFASSPCYRWLKNYAARYHLFEHRLEPWHWSTTGK